MFAHWIVTVTFADGFLGGNGEQCAVDRVGYGGQRRLVRADGFNKRRMHFRKAQMSAPTDAVLAFTRIARGAPLRLPFSTEDLQVVQIGLKYAGFAHHAHLECLLGWLVREQAGDAMPLAPLAYSQLAVAYAPDWGQNDAVHSVAAEGTNVLGARIEPPVH